MELWGPVQICNWCYKLVFEPTLQVSSSSNPQKAHPSHAKQTLGRQRSVKPGSRFRNIIHRLKAFCQALQLLMVCESDGETRNEMVLPGKHRESSTFLATATGFFGVKLMKLTATYFPGIYLRNSIFTLPETNSSPLKLAGPQNISSNDVQVRAVS